MRHLQMGSGNGVRSGTSSASDETRNSPSKQDILIHCLSLDRRGPEINNGVSTTASQPLAAGWCPRLGPGAVPAEEERQQVIGGRHGGGRDCAAPVAADGAAAEGGAVLAHRGGVRRGQRCCGPVRAGAWSIRG